MVKLFEFFNMVVIFFKMSGSAKIKTSPATPAYYSCEHAHSRHISSTSHFWYLPEARAAKKNDPWCLPVILVYSNLTFMKIHILMKLWHSCVTQCPVLFRFKEWSPASGSKTGGSGVPYVYGKTMGKSVELSNFSNFSIWLLFFTKCPA